MLLSKLLLVEDNQEAADLAMCLLQYGQPYVIVHRTTGEDALKTLQAETFDGILLDYSLPDMDGLQVCNIIREFNKAIPILLTTAYLSKVTEEAMREAGITGFIPKPWSQN